MSRATAAIVAALVVAGLGGCDRGDAGPAAGPYASTPAGWGSIAVACDLARRAAIDPIVSPGTMPSAHEHDFAGNLAVDASSTGATLRAGATNCDVDDDRSAYWFPTIRRDGTPVDPDRIVVYYRVPPGVAALAALPVGLELVGGGGDRTFGWGCRGDRPEAAVPRSCPAGAPLQLHVVFPECWNGDTDWSGDAPSAVAAVDGRCPSAYPAQLPQVELVVHTGLTGELGEIVVASEPHVPPHADLIAAWPAGGLPPALASCLADHVDCASTP